MPSIYDLTMQEFMALLCFMCDFCGSLHSIWSFCTDFMQMNDLEVKSAIFFLFFLYVVKLTSMGVVISRCLHWLLAAHFLAKILLNFARSLLFFEKFRIGMP